MVATTAPAHPPMDHTAARMPPLATTPLRGLMHAARRPRLLTARKKLVRRTTRTPEPMPRRIKPPTPMGATEARSTPRTATLRTPSIKLPRKDRWDRYRLRRVAKVSPRRARTATMRPPAKLQVEPSTRRQTAMSTRTPGAVGTRHRALPITPLATRAHRATTRLLLTAMESSQRPAGHRPLVAAAEAVGNPGRRALVVRQAAVVVAAGAVAGKPRGTHQTKPTFVSGVG